MAKVKIELNLKKASDLRDYNLFNNAGGMFDALFEISCNLKKKAAFRFDNEDNGAFDMVFEMIADILEENNVIIDKLN
jgi:hypothetical protein